MKQGQIVIEALPRESVLARVFRIMPGTKIAKELGLTKQAVYQWMQVPPKHVLEVERLTGISRHELRSDIYGPADAP